MRFTRGRKAALVVAAACVLAALTVVSPAGVEDRRPKLVVVLVVDQMREDYLDRFAGYYTGAFRRFLREGALFSDAHHDHAITVTAAGHATISTGCFPSHHGIVGNEWYDRGTRADVYCTADASVTIVGRPSLPGQSPASLRRPALGDWLKASSPGSRVFSVAFKDRASIEMGGARPDGAFWYDDTSGRFVTSTYYARSYPAWVDAFNASGRVDAHFAEGWRKLLPEEAYFVSTEDRVAAENDGEHVTFPYVFDDGSPDAKTSYHKKIWATPFGDELAIEFARALVKNERLGAGSSTDMLWLSCSTADVVGHRFGPLSQEAEDTYLRLDRALAALFDDLDSTLGPDRYVVALSSDHGVLPLPEELVRRGLDAGRVSTEDYASAINDAIADVARDVGATGKILAASTLDGIILDPTAAPVPPEELRRRVAERIRKIPFVADAFTIDELAAGASGRRYLESYRHSYFDGRTPDVLVLGREYWLVNFGAHGTTHGTPYGYNTHVPLVFLGAGVRAGTHAEPVRTVDLAPTLAELAGIRVPAGVDGRSLATAFAVRAGSAVK